MVSPEDKKVLKIAQKIFDIHYRDPYYSTSKVPMSEVYSYIASEIEGENIAWINVTNPLSGHEIYNGYQNLFKDAEKFDCLLSAVENKQNFFYKIKELTFEISPPRSQDLDPLVSLSFVINILKRKIW